MTILGIKRLLAAVAVIGIFWTVVTARAAEVTMFAAASLTDSLKEMAANYEKQSGNKILFNFGASSMVAGNIPGKTSTLSLAIFQYVQLGQDSQAYHLLAVSVLLAFAAVWCSEWLLRGRRH
jgi:hypothetical protein